MNKKAILIPIALLTLGAVGYGIYRRIHAEERNGTLYGNVDIREASLAFRVGGRVESLKVDEGATVKAGDVLATLDPEPLQNSLRSAEAAVAALAARNALMHRGYRPEDIAETRARLEAAQAVLAETEANLARQSTLAPEGASTQRSLDAARSARDQAAAQVRVTEQQTHQMTTGFRQEEVAESDAQLRQAQAQVAAASLALKDATLVAPSDGIILTRAIEKGNMVQAGAPAFSLSLTSPVWTIAYVSEPMLGRFPPSTKVILTTDSRPDQPYHGVVGFVSPTAEFTPKSVETADLRTSLVYRLRIVVTDPDSQLRQGMPVTVRRVR
ncbi:MAG: secretion protein HlyD [Geothrix sp.]|nr:secretion protein HlyD [Geothrix sp.]